MNKYIIPFFVITSTFSQASNATHAYRSEDCVSTSHNFSYLGNYPFGGYYGFSKVGHENEEEMIHALPLGDDQEGAEIIFEKKNEVTVSKEPTEHQCWFDHDEWTSTKDISIEQISDAASKKLGLKKGDVLSIFCKETFDIPNGDHCGDDD